MPFKIGDEVKTVSAHFGWGAISQGDVGIVSNIGGVYDPYDYMVSFRDRGFWSALERDLVLTKPPRKDRRLAKKLVPMTPREKIAVSLVRKVIEGEGRFTAVKVESEGRLSRVDRCTDECTLRNQATPHLGCKYFGEVKVANDFILAHLAKHGLAKKCKPGESSWGYLYKPVLPLVFSKVYTDSETEWTTTLLLKDPTDVLYAPLLVDAFNALAEANGNGIDVTGSGMHTAFIQGEDGIYPSREAPGAQSAMFRNFAKSMGPLLPALYLLGANRIEDGQGVTRSTGPRQPIVSEVDKYSAIAYRYGAVEFRVFDTCYDNREQLLDNIVVMAQSIRKYWHKKYVSSNITMDKPVLFGNTSCSINRVNKLESLYLVKEHIVLLNQGLRCIKPPYQSVKEIKMARRFTLTVRGVKNILVTDMAKDAYAGYLRKLEVSRALSRARAFYSAIDNFQYSYAAETDIPKVVRKLNAAANKESKQRYPVQPIEQVTYKELFGEGYLLGES